MGSKFIFDLFSV